MKSWPHGSTLVEVITTVLPQGGSPEIHATLFEPWVPEEMVAEVSKTKIAIATEMVVRNCILIERIHALNRLNKLDWKLSELNDGPKT